MSTTRIYNKINYIKILKKPNLLLAILTSILLVSIIFQGCASTSGSKKTTPVKPEWIQNRPISSAYFYGIGSSLRNGSADRYRNQARENALSEMAGQINTQISSNMVLYTVEDRFGVREMLQNRIKTESKEFLEGYEFMDQWEDETRYYTIYRLSKSVYEQNKEQRKKVAAEGAYLKYQQAIKHLHGKNYLMAYTLFAQTLEGIKNYLQEGVVITSPQGYNIDLGGGSLTFLDEIIQSFRLKTNYNNLSITGEEPTEELLFTLTDNKNNPIIDIPVKFNYSGGFLLTDTGKSDENGIIRSPVFKAPAQNTRETLYATIDVQALARIATFDLDIRRMLEKWNSASARVLIEFVR